MAKNLKRLCLFATGVVAGIHLSEAVFNGKKVYFKQVPLQSNKIASNLDGYCIVFVSDIHDYPLSELTKVVDKIKKIKPDLLLLGGDYSIKQSRCKDTLRLLSTVKPRDGIFAVDGNHDNIKNVHHLYQQMEVFGITPLVNKGVYIRDNLYIAGTSDMKHNRGNAKEALQFASKQNFNILVSHNPDITMTQDTRLADITLCGHTHGGEISLFGKLPLALMMNSHVTKYGKRFVGGFSKSKYGADVYVSQGLGSHMPLRVYANREVSVITLQKGDSKSK